MPAFGNGPTAVDVAAATVDGSQQPHPPAVVSTADGRQSSSAAPVHPASSSPVGLSTAGGGGGSDADVEPSPYGTPQASAHKQHRSTPAASSVTPVASSSSSSSSVSSSSPAAISATLTAADTVAVVSSASSSSSALSSSVALSSASVAETAAAAVTSSSQHRQHDRMSGARALSGGDVADYSSSSSSHSRGVESGDDGRGARSADSDADHRRPVRSPVQLRQQSERAGADAGGTDTSAPTTPTIGPATPGGGKDDSKDGKKRSHGKKSFFYRRRRVSISKDTKQAAIIEEHERAKREREAAAAAAAAETERREAEERERVTRDARAAEEREDRALEQEERRAKLDRESARSKHRDRVARLDAKRTQLTISVSELEELEEYERLARLDKEAADEESRVRRQELLDMQAEVVDAIGRETQAILAQNEREDAHWEKQEQRFKLMVQRMTLGAKTAEELHQFLLKANTAMSKYAESVSQQGSFGRDETGSLRQASIAQEFLTSTTTSHYSEMKDRVFNETVRQSHLLSKHMMKKTEAMNVSGTKIARDIKHKRVKLMDAWREYEKLVAERQRNRVNDEVIKNDPLLTCRAYDREMQRIHDVEADYVKEMSRLFLELKVDDGRRIDAIKSIMLDYLLAQKTVLEHQVKFTDQAIASVKAIDREKDVMEFICAADLLCHVPSKDNISGGGNNNSKQQQQHQQHQMQQQQQQQQQSSMSSLTSAASITTVFEVPPPNRDPHILSRLYAHEVALEGELCRQGRFFKSSWKGIYAYVSRSGFFHYFETADSLVPDLSIPLYDCEVSPAKDTHKLAFEIAQPNKSFFAIVSHTRYFFKVTKKEQLARWIDCIRMFCVRPADEDKQPPPPQSGGGGNGSAEEKKEDGGAGSGTSTDADIDDDGPESGIALKGLSGGLDDESHRHGKHRHYDDVGHDHENLHINHNDYSGHNRCYRATSAGSTTTDAADGDIDESGIGGVTSGGGGDVSSSSTSTSAVAMATAAAVANGVLSDGGSVSGSGSSAAGEVPPSSSSAAVAVTTTTGVPDDADADADDECDEDVNYQADDDGAGANGQGMF